MQVWISIRHGTTFRPSRKKSAMTLNKARMKKVRRTRVRDKMEEASLTS